MNTKNIECLEDTLKKLIFHRDQQFTRSTIELFNKCIKDLEAEIEASKETK